MTEYNTSDHPELRVIDNLQSDLAEARAQLATARAVALAEISRTLRRHADDATLDTTGVERKTLIRAAGIVLDDGGEVLTLAGHAKS